MIVPVRRWLNGLKYILLFIVLSILLYQLLEVVGAWMEPAKYREPDGEALKVFQHELGLEEEYDSLFERLRLFYWYGE